MAGKFVKRRRQIDRSADTQHLLIDAAIEVLCEKGFVHASTSAIAARAGVTTGALHHHFLTKDDLLFGVLDHLSDKIVLEFRVFGRKSRGKPIDLHRLVVQLWTVYGNPQYWAIWEIIIGSRSDGRLHDRLVQHRERTMEALYQCWLDMNPSLEKIDGRTVEAFDLLLTSIRGLCLERFLKADAAFFQKQLHLLATTIAPHLVNPAPSASVLEGKRKP